MKLTLCALTTTAQIIPGISSHTLTSTSGYTIMKGQRLLHITPPPDTKG